MKAYLVFDEDEKKPVWTGWMMEQLRERGHEIEIPDFATTAWLDYGWNGRIYHGACGEIVNRSEYAISIHIPRPKKKIKKWRWVIAVKKGKDIGTTQHMTEEELHYYYPNQRWYHKIDETEIEVEE